jgi:hypothetical protein
MQQSWPMHGLEDWFHLTMDGFREKYFSFFLGYLAVSTAQLGQRWNRLLFLVTSSLFKYGLSEIGNDFAHTLGFSMATTTYQSNVQKLHASYVSGIDEKIGEALWTVVFWYDNFVKSYYSTTLSIDNTNWRPANHTPVAVYLTANEHSAFTMMLPPAPQQVLPCMPSSDAFFGAAAVLRVIRAIRGSQRLIQPKWWETYYATSLTVSEGIWNVPVKPANAVAYDRQNKANKLKPYDVLETTVQTTVGLAHCVHHLHEVFGKVWDTGNYSHTVVDVNIYMRLIKYYFSQWKYFPELQIKNTHWQGVWHIVKISYEKIWNYHWLTIIAPAYRKVVGDQAPMTIYSTHQHKVAFFSDMALAYHRERRRFLRLYEREENDAILTLKTFFEYLLPVVRIFFA